MYSYSFIGMRYNQESSHGTVTPLSYEICKMTIWIVLEGNIRLRLCGRGTNILFQTNISELLGNADYYLYFSGSTH